MVPCRNQWKHCPEPLEPTLRTGWFRQPEYSPGSIGREDLKNATFVEKKENLILYGPVGTGKTHLATALGVAACMNGRKVKFYRTAALVNELIDAQSNGMLKKFLKPIEQADLLICDEWGYIPLDLEGAKLLYQVIADCYEKKSIILTTNLEFSKWNSIFFDEKLTNAIIDRMVHHSYCWYSMVPVTGCRILL